MATSRERTLKIDDRRTPSEGHPSRLMRWDDSRGHYVLTGTAETESARAAVPLASSSASRSVTTDSTAPRTCS